jgi:hypothetical protein
MEDNNSFQEIETVSWLSRIKNAIIGIFFGIILFIGSFVALIWNEGHYLKTFNSLEEGQAMTQTISPGKIDPQHEGRLVHLYGMTTTVDQLSDLEFKITASAIALQRSVEMYQWQENEHSETKKEVGGRETIEHIYTYTKDWFPNAIVSAKFKKQEQHINPSAWQFSSKTLRAKHVELGAFYLSDPQIARIANYEPINVDETNLPSVLLQNGGYYLGKDPNSPEVGDLKISYSIVKPSEITLVTRQIGGTFEPYYTHAGDSIDMLELGSHSSEYMYEQSLEKNSMLTWLGRGIGLLLMWVGLSLVFKPLAVVADVLPILGFLLDTGVAMVTGFIALSLSLITIATSWILYRPFIGVPLLVLGVAVPFVFKFFKKGVLLTPPSQSN